MAPGTGPTWAIDGPLPLARPYGLLGSAAGHPAVRIVPDVDKLAIERWGHGVAMEVYPPDQAAAWDACAVASEFVVKAEGGILEVPEFGAFVVYVTETCSPRSVFGSSRPQEDWAAKFLGRASRVLEAIESAAVEYELLTGAVVPSSPHLTDAGTGYSGYQQQGFPNGNTVTSPRNGLAILEDSIAESGRQGVIHVTPGFAVSADAGVWHDWDAKTPVLMTRNGTLVVAGAGYSQARLDNLGQPHGHTAITFPSTREWIYASGPIDVRRSAMFTNPEPTPEMIYAAVDRENNVLTYRAERYYLVDWDKAVQAAVFVDRCRETC